MRILIITITTSLILISNCYAANNYGHRPDGTLKGKGWLGEIHNPDGSISTELSISVNIDDKDLLIPLLVPGLTIEEIRTLQNITSPKDIPENIINKAITHAFEMLGQGKSPFK